MKPALILCILFACSAAFAQERIIDPFPGNSAQLVDQGIKLYPVEKGLIAYSSEDQPGDTVIFSFDRYGWRQLTTEKGEKTYYGIKAKVNTRLQKDGAAVHTVNLIDNKGITSIETEYVDLAKYKNPHELLEAQMSRIGAELAGSEVVLDKECEVWKYFTKGKECKIWIWNSLILKDRGEKYTRTATSLNLNPDLSDQTFELPDNITWRLPTN
jgi:hypothetical protein